MGQRSPACYRKALGFPPLLFTSNFVTNVLEVGSRSSAFCKVATQVFTNFLGHSKPTNLGNLVSGYYRNNLAEKEASFLLIDFVAPSNRSFSPPFFLVGRGGVIFGHGALPLRVELAP